MSHTFQEIIDDVRVTLNDASGVRYTDEQLMGYCNDGVSEMFRMRPDFRLGSGLSWTAEDPDYVATDAIPLPHNVQKLLSYYVVFRSELRDDEYSEGTRAANLRSLWQRELIQK